MKYKLTITTIFSGILLLFFSCKTTKNSFINRSYHSVTTKFNVLHNGHESFKRELEKLNNGYQENYNELLPIEPLKLQHEGKDRFVKMSERKIDTSFKFAEDKAVKAVQLHSMNIRGRERNRQIDDAYLLLGKTRYFSQRFVPAIEAFNYILKNYPNASLIDETRIWHAKTNIRLESEKQAISMLNLVLNQEKNERKIKENAHTVMAMAHIKIDSFQQAILHLNKAVEVSKKNHDRKARNLFILGQLYRIQKEIDSSQMVFNELISYRKAPYKYKIHARLEKVKNEILNDSVTNTTVKIIKKLIKDRDNRPYLDKLYFQLARIDYSKDSVQSAFKNLQKSIHAQQATNEQKILSFEMIGDIYFDQKEYLAAGAYYDSVLQIAFDDNSKKIRRLKRKNKNLEKIRYYEALVSQHDEVLYVVSLDSESQLAYYQSIVDTLKARDMAAKAKVESLLALQEENNNIGKGKWYFYNKQALKQGEEIFVNQWGYRKLEDNWRLIDKTTIDVEEEDLEDVAVEKTATTLKKYDPYYYISELPTLQSDIDSIKLQRDDAYYQLGLMYKDQFKAYDLAAEKFEKLLGFQPIEYLILPTHYHLYKTYQASENTAKTDFYKNEILSTYPDSRFAKIIKNPNNVLISGSANNTPEKAYEKVYCDYEFHKKYKEVLLQSDEAIEKYQGLQIVPKFELLKAYAYGKLEGMQSFKKALEQVAIAYPNTEEGKKAIALIEKIEIKSKEKE